VVDCGARALGIDDAAGTYLFSRKFMRYKLLGHGLHSASVNLVFDPP